MDQIATSKRKALVKIGFWHLWGPLVVLLAFPAQATELDRLKLSFSERGIKLSYNTDTVSGILSLYHATSLDTPRDSWQFVSLHPATVLEGSFEISSVAYQTGDFGFFEIRDNSFEAPKNLVWIQPGRFLLGSPEHERNRYPDEGPQHEVSIDNGFWMSKYEVTQSEFERVMGANPSRASGRPNAPVESVSWIDASTYCLRLTERAKANGELPDGYEYRLPTEAEWEYACRAGTETAFHFGDDESDLSLYGWWAENSGASPFEVGLLRPNDWGLYDMHGNVFEWCYSKYEAYPGGEIRNLKLDYRVIRGGAFICPSEIVRSACRFESAPMTSASWLTGFRVALGPILPKPEALRQ